MTGGTRGRVSPTGNPETCFFRGYVEGQCESSEPD